MRSTQHTRRLSERQRSYLSLSITGYLQVFCVSFSTVSLSKGFVPGIVVAAFLVSLIWTLNVKKISISNWPERIVYSAAAAMGSLTGYFFTQLLKSFF